VDLGPHRFFSVDKRVNQLWLEVVGRDYRMVDRLTRILYRGRLFHYPLKAIDALAKLGPGETARCVASYVKECLFPAQGHGSFEDWVVRAFGRRLYEIFFKAYSEKLWGISCQDLDADFAAQRIKKLSMAEAMKAVVFGKGGDKHKTLVERFPYPLEGTGMVYGRMAEAVKARGQRMYLATPVESVVVRGGRVTGLRLATGEFRPYSCIISTMPLTSLVQRLPEVPDDIRAKSEFLGFRNTVLVYLHTDGERLFPDNWLYVHSPELKLGRLTNFRNWVPALYGDKKTTILCLEYWASDRDGLWNCSDEELIGLACREIRQIPLAAGARVLEGYVHRIKRCYPVYARGYKEYLKPLEAYLSAIRGLVVIGRCGAFKYNNQDHSILMGILAARNILHGERNDVWAVNTDYETYQERATISETGLK